MKHKLKTIKAKLVFAMFLAAGLSSLCMLALCIIMLIASKNMAFAVFFLAHVIEFTILFLMIFSVLTIVFFLLLIKGNIRYLEEIRSVLDDVSDGNLDIHIPVRTTDELGIMAQSVNDMAYKLKTSIEEERALEKTKNDLITSISHDLRTPLTSILGYLELIHRMEAWDQEKLTKYSSIALKQCMDLKSLIEDLFEYTKVSNADVKLNLIHVNLSELVEQVVLGFIPEFQEAGMDYRLIFPNSKVSIYADPTLLTRVFDNLIRNAIMYGKKGNYVDIKLYQEDDSAVIQIINYGEPIPEADIPHVFEKLYRVDKSQSSDGGTGIGLAIVKSIIDLHKGSIHVESTEYSTVFEVRLACTKKPNP